MEAWMQPSPTQVRTRAETIPLEEWALGFRAQHEETLRALRSQRDRLPGYGGPPSGYSVRHLPAIVYGSAGGEVLCQELFLPEDAPAPLPAIAIFHGGGWRDRGQSRYAEVDEALWWATRGFAAASVQYRLAPRHQWPAMLEDAQAAIRWLRTQGRAYGVDPHRVAASGFSAGAHLAVLLALLDAGGDGVPAPRATHQESVASSRADLALPRATPVLVWRTPQVAGIRLGRGQPGASLFGGWMEMDGVRRAIYEELFGAPVEQLPDEPPPYFDPLGYVSPEAAPVFITHSKRDYLPLQNAAALYDALRAAGKRPGEDLDLDLLDGTGHPQTHAVNVTVEEQSRHDWAVWRFVARHFRLQE
jgi:acetyl esterase/lipase